MEQTKHLPLSLYGLEAETIAEILSLTKNFQAKQIFNWLVKGVYTFEAMTDLPKAERERLSSLMSSACSSVFTSETDESGATKMGIRLHDSKVVECVLLVDKRVGTPPVFPARSDAPRVHLLPNRHDGPLSQPQCRGDHRAVHPPALGKQAAHHAYRLYGNGRTACQYCTSDPFNPLLPQSQYLQYRPQTHHRLNLRCSAGHSQAYRTKLPVKLAVSLIWSVPTTVCAIGSCRSTRPGTS